MKGFIHIEYSVGFGAIAARRDTTALGCKHSPHSCFVSIPPCLDSPGRGRGIESYKGWEQHIDLHIMEG